MINYPPDFKLPSFISSFNYKFRSSANKKKKTRKISEKRSLAMLLFASELLFAFSKFRGSSERDSFFSIYVSCVAKIKGERPSKRTIIPQCRDYREKPDRGISAVAARCGRPVLPYTFTIEHCS